MLSFKNLPLRHKQTLIMMLTSALTLLLACVAFVGVEALNFRTALSDEISTMTQIVGNNCAAALDFDDPKAAGSTLEALRAEPPIANACVYDLQGHVFARYQRDDQSKFIEFPNIQPPGHEFRDHQLRVFLPITMQGEKVGTVYVACDLYELNDRLKRIAVIAMLVLGVSLLAAFLLSMRLQRVISGPVLQLAQAVRTVAMEKNYSVRATKQSDDELGQLVDGFNEMLSQIQRRDSALEFARNELEVRVVDRTAELARTNEALQRQQTELRILFDLMPALIWFKDTNNGILRVNKRVAENLGMAIEEIEGKPCLEIYPEDAAKYYIDDLEVIRSGNPKLGIVETMRDGDGNERRVQTDKVPFCDKDGKVVGVVVMAQDITDRKRFEAQLFQSQKMETVGKLAGGIAHEFNSIMTAIIGQSELMLSDLSIDNPLRKNATEIRKAADRAATLTRQLLAFGRKQILQPEILDLKTLVTGMESMLLHLVGRNVGVLITSAAGPKTVKADAGQIEQVIVNIVMNAADAMPNGGKLTLEIANATLDEVYVSRFPELKAGNYVMIAITDTGAGMSENVKARVFEPFFTTKGVGKGTGLGLATCHGIIKQSGGHIAVYSEKGRGATFKIYLPQVDQMPRVVAQQQAPADLPRGTETILLVEDDPALREMAATLLGRLGYTVLTASDGVEALTLTHQKERGHIDLLFTDVVMPHMSGKELADRVQMLFPKTRILFTSAYTESAIVHQGALNPGVELIQKPFTPSTLANKVREILDQGKTRLIS